MQNHCFESIREYLPGIIINANITKAMEREIWFVFLETSAFADICICTSCRPKVIGIEVSFLV
jgi:hypothetical protein